MTLKRPLSLMAALLITATPLSAGEIWVSNEKDDTVSVIDTETLEVIRTIDVGERPCGITFSKDFSKLYVCASDDDTVQVIDPNTGKILHDLPSGEDPEQFVLHPDDVHLYIANENDAITTSETTNMAHWIDTRTQELFANTPVDSRPRHAEFTKGGSELWVSSEIGGTITVFDVPTQAETAKISFEISNIHSDRVQPVGFKFTPDEKTVFVALGPSTHVAVINAETYEVEEYVLVGRRVWHMEFNGDKSQLFTTNGVSGDVTVIDVASRKAIKSIKVGRFPWGAAYRPKPHA